MSRVGRRERDETLKLLVINWQDRLNPKAGGAEIHLHEIFGRIACRGHEVVALVSGWEAARSREIIDGIDVHRTGGRHTFSLAAPHYYRRSLAALPFDLVIEDLNKVPLFTPFWLKRRLLLLVHHLFGATAFVDATPPVAAATWILERPLGRVYAGVPVEAVSESTADDLVRRGFDRSAITVIPNGVDLERYSPAAPHARAEQPTVLYLGRLRRYKRVDLVLRAAALLRDQGVAFRVVIAGRGDAAATLRTLTSRLGLDEHVRLAGFVSEDEKVRLMRSAWVHVLTSSKEGWGISNLEAAACGTPTVASDSPGLRDSVIHGVTGFLTPYGDVAALADALRAVLQAPELRERLGAAARAFAAQHSWEASADRTESHLLQIVSAASGTDRAAERHVGPATMPKESP